MKIYRIFLKKDKNGVIDDLEIIKDGFNLFPLIFQVFYLLYKKLWIYALILFTFFTFLNFLQYSEIIKSYIIIPIEITTLIYICFECSDWLSKRLIKKGYTFLGYSSGNNIKEAKLKFLENINNNYENQDKMEQKIF